MEFDYPIDMTREQAMIRRADKLTGILRRYKYQDASSSASLSEFIDIIIDAISPSLQDKEEKVTFLRKINKAKTILRKKTEGNNDEQDNYTKAIASLFSFLEEYKSFMAEQLHHGEEN